MIQRIQTLYLLLVALLVVAAIFLPLAWFGMAGEQLDLYAFALRSSAGEVMRPPLYTGIVLSVAALLPLVCIFLYKRRLLQLRLCVVEMVLLVGSEVMLAAYYFFGHGATEFQGMKPAIALPLVAVLFAYLAARAIFHDELLVRSLDRIR
ncbi:MAG: DUF4293 domain-containing protein [Alistipes sp.]